MKFQFLLTVILLNNFPALTQNIEWAKHVAGRGISDPAHLSPGESYCYGIAVDALNNVCITGYCNDTVDFDPGPVEFLQVGGNDDIFLAKYDPDGNLIWAHVLKSAGWNYAVDIKTDLSNNILITGRCFSQADFDPGPGVALLPSSGTSNNYIFLAKYDPNGNFIWAKNMISSLGAASVSLDLDGNSNIYITGDFYNDIDMDPGPGSAMLTSNQNGIFFGCYNSSGNLLWANALSGTGNLGGASQVRVSKQGSIFITGFFGNSVDFDPGAGSAIINAATTADRYFAKYAPGGFFSWARSINTNNGGGLTVGRSIKLDADIFDNVYVTGDFSGTVDFDPGPGIQNLSWPNSYSTYIGKYDSNGNLLWVEGLFGTYCNATNIIIDCNRDINLAGTFARADFDPGQGVHLVTSTAPSAFMNFFARYDSAGNFIWVAPVSNCGYGGSVLHPCFAISENSQYVAGGFKQTADFDPGPDSTLKTATGVGTNAYFSKYNSPSIVDLGSDSTLCNGDSLLLDVTSLSATYLWQDLSTLPTYLVTTAGTFWVKTTIRECHSSDTIIVAYDDCDLPEIKIPNVFTPEGDGKNETFHPIKAKKIGYYKLSIYNRWGQLLFSSNAPGDGWNGKHNDSDCPDGTYFYILDYSFINQKQSSLSGCIELIR